MKCGRKRILDNEFGGEWLKKKDRVGEGIDLFFFFA
jgi:hypothetical protein